MIRLMKRLMTMLITMVLLAAFGYFVLLPRVLPRTYQNHVESCAAQYQLPQSLIYAVIFSESHFEPDAVSSAGAVGLMQVTEETGWWIAAQMGIDADGGILGKLHSKVEEICVEVSAIGMEYDAFCGKMRILLGRCAGIES